MSSPYRYLLFDADGTLFDFAAAEAAALTATVEQFGLTPPADLAARYQALNAAIWAELERGEITPAALKTERFRRLFAAIGAAADPAEFGHAYLAQLATMNQLLDDAEDVVAALAPRHRIAIITNGLSLVQRGRLSRSPIRQHIAALIISEEVGAAKPDPRIFERAFEALGHPPRDQILLIGDSLSSDIQGAANAGIDACWFNPDAAPRPAGLPLRHEIRGLRALLPLLTGGAA